MDSKLLGLISVFLLVFGVFMSVLLFNGTLSSVTKAQNELIPSGDKSIILGFPLSLKADGQNTSTITVWVRNTAGKGVPTRKVELTTSLGNLNSSTVITNAQGRAVFLLSSTTPGIAKLQAIIDGSLKPGNNVSIEFTQ